MPDEPKMNFNEGDEAAKFNEKLTFVTEIFVCEKHGERPQDEYLRVRVPHDSPPVYYCMVCISERLAATFKPMKVIERKTTEDADQ